MEIRFFHWETGDCCVLLVRSPLANMGMCSAVQVLILCLEIVGVLICGYRVKHSFVFSHPCYGTHHSSLSHIIG